MHITNGGRGVHKREVKGVDRLRRLPKDWYCFTNLDLAIGPGRSREIDVILVAEDRIFLIDLKDWGGKVESDSGNWLHNGRDTGPSPVGKIHQNAKEVAYLLKEHVRRHMKGALAPHVVGLVVITGLADLSGIAATEVSSVLAVEDFIAAVSTPSARVGTFGPVNRAFVATPLTEIVWKDQLSKFFNARTGKIRPGRRRYANFVVLSDNATFEHSRRIFAEYEAVDENAAQTLGTLRVWDFAKADTRFQNEEARKEIVGRERSVIEYLKDRSEACETAILQSRAEDLEHGVGYWEVFDRRQRLKRLSEFVNAEAEALDRDSRIELARQLVARVAALHAVDAAHLDLGGHSVWLETPSTVKLSHLMAAQYAQVASLGENRYQFLSSAKLPEDILGGESEPKRKDVFLLAVAVHWLLLGTPPASVGEDMPFEWNPKADPEARYQDLHLWLERGLSLAPADRFRDAAEALDEFNSETASRPTVREVIEGLERFRSEIRSQRQFFAIYPEAEAIRESDRVDIWKSERQGAAVLVKFWKRASWGDQTKDGPRILDFLSRARDFALSPPAACARILEVHWLNDAIAVVQEWVEGLSLAKALGRGDFNGRSDSVLKFALHLANRIAELHEQGFGHGDLKPDNIIVAASDGAPVFIDLADFSATDDGEIKSTAYAPPIGGRIERDRFAVTKIVEELFSVASLPPTIGADLARISQTGGASES